MNERAEAELPRASAGQGDESAFREIVLRHTDLLYSAALRQVGSQESARDVQPPFRASRTLAAKA